MKTNARQPMNSRDGKRITLRLTAEQERRHTRLPKKVRRRLVPELRRRVNPILNKLETNT